jgi:uncharacterized protein YgbK (DUF1537 family)
VNAGKTTQLRSAPNSPSFPPPPWGLIADDLTGACDAAAPFAARGIPVKVLLGRDPAEISRDGLTAISTESRDLASELAAESVAAACRWLAVNGVRTVFKKLDSVLRGHVVEEVAAALESTGMHHAVLTPALPKMGRIVIGGQLLLPSQPAFAPIDLRETFSSLPAVRIADAATEADLAAIVETAFQAEPIPLLAGSAGLATALASSLAARFLQGSNAPMRPHCDAALYFIGSPHNTPTAQLDYLIARRQPAIRPLDGLEVDAGVLANDRLVVRVGWQDPSREQCQPVWKWLESHPHAGIVLSGGDTAAFFCEAAGAHAIELGGEAFAGIPWGILRGGRADGRVAVTKSGGFGGENTLVEVDDFLREH